MKGSFRVCMLAKSKKSARLVGLLLDDDEVDEDGGYRSPVPQFTHILFETLSCCINYMVKAAPATVADFERHLYPEFDAILKIDSCPEVHPYIFTLMAYLLESNKEVQPVYRDLLKPLLDAERWKNLGNVPALLRFLKAYVRKGADVIGPNIPNVGICQMLIGIKRVDHLGMDLLCWWW